MDHHHTGNRSRVVQIVVWLLFIVVALAYASRVVIILSSKHRSVWRLGRIASASFWSISQIGLHEYFLLLSVVRNYSSKKVIEVSK